MRRPRPAPLPDDALLQRYQARGFVDAYCCEWPHAVSLADLVAAFYRSAAFRPERWLLGLLGMPANNAQALQLGHGETDRYAAWREEDRRDNELLMCDVSGRTRSWFKVESLGAAQTRLWFGSAVVARQAADGGPRLGGLFTALLPFHRLYSRVLLAGAVRELKSAYSAPQLGPEP